MLKSLRPAYFNLSREYEKRNKEKKRVGSSGKGGRKRREGENRGDHDHPHVRGLRTSLITDRGELGEGRVSRKNEEKKKKRLSQEKGKNWARIANGTLLREAAASLMGENTL